MEVARTALAAMGRDTKRVLDKLLKIAIPRSRCRPLEIEQLMLPSLSASLVETLCMFAFVIWSFPRRARDNLCSKIVEVHPFPGVEPQLGVPGNPGGNTLLPGKIPGSSSICK